MISSYYRPREGNVIGGFFMIATLYEPFRHWSEGGSVYILSDIPSIHRVTIDAANLRKG